MEQFEQLLTCAICLDRYRNPKLLPCQHSFCMEPCMDGLVDYVRRQVKCPECRAEHRIPYQVYILILLKHNWYILIYNIVIIRIEYDIELFIFKIIINKIINFCVCFWLLLITRRNKLSIYISRLVLEKQFFAIPQNIWKV